MTPWRGWGLVVGCIVLSGALRADGAGPLALPRNAIEGALDRLADLTEPRNQRNEQQQQAEDRRQDLVDRAELAAEVGRLAADLLAARAEINARIDALDASDRAAQREWESHMGDGPSIPVSCAPGRGGCYACYSGAVEDIDRSRRLLIQLHTRGLSTVAVYRAGERLAGVVQGASAAAGMAVSASRGYYMDQPMARFTQSYERKADEMLDALEVKLRALGACEAQYYNVQDWYNRFGFMYMSFMRSKYEHVPQ
jgi:seryl-tRNA synthetase